MANQSVGFTSATVIFHSYDNDPFSFGINPALINVSFVRIFKNSARVIDEFGSNTLAHSGPLLPRTIQYSRSVSISDL